MSLLALYRPTGMLTRQGVRTFVGSAVVAAKKTDPSVPKVPKVPKGPVTAYGSFVKEFYAENKEALKDPATGKATLGRITQAVSEAWKNLSESQKETYNAAAKEAKKAYDSTYKSFYESLSPETKKAIEKATGKKLSVPGGKLRAKQALREQPGYPGAPLTAFFEYLKDLREGGTVDTAGLEASEANLAVAKEAGNRWKAMSDSEKQEWKDKAAANKKRYEEWQAGRR